jgi:WavE lipopolysaccharide synthesis
LHEKKQQVSYHRFHLDGFKNKKKIIWANQESLSVLNRYKGLMEQIDFITLTDSNLWGKNIESIPIINPAEIVSYPDKNGLIIFVLIRDYWNSITKFLYKYQIYNCVPVDLFQPYTAYAKRFEDIILQYNENPKFIYNRNGKEAILIRGKFEPFFTRLIIKHLRINYPDKYIVLSTWTSTDKNLYEDLNLDYVVLNDEPQNSGQGNRNYQITCVKNGLKLLKEKGFKEVLIQRTDQILLRGNLIERCKRLLEKYPNKIGYLNKRIIVSNYYFRKYMYYHPSDMFMYGDIDDLLSFWDVPLDPTPKETHDLINKISQKNNVTLEQFFENSIKERYTEIYLMRRMLDNIGYSPKNTMEDWLYLAANLFIIKNIEWWEFFWFKPDKISATVQLLKEGFPWNNIDETEWEDLQEQY